MFAGKFLKQTGSLFSSRGSTDTSAVDERELHDLEGRELQKKTNSREIRSNSSASDYSKEYFEAPSMSIDSDIDRLEDLLQMGCMDALFLPQDPKPAAKKSLVKVNSQGHRELNLNVKGALALGLEAQMREDAKNRKEGNHSFYLEDGTKVPEFHKNDHFRSLMSLSHESASSGDFDDGRSDDSDIRNANFNQPFQLPPHPMQQPHPASWQHQHQHQHYNPHMFHDNQNDYYQQQQYHQMPMMMAQPNSPYAMVAHGISPPFHQQAPPQERKSGIMEVKSEVSAPGRMPLQIVLENTSSYEEDSCLSYENAAAPDPPQSSLERIPEDDYSSCASSEKESDTSIVACGSMKSDNGKNSRGSHNRASKGDVPKEINPNEILPKEIVPKSGKRLTNLERWKKANIQRLYLKKNQMALTGIGSPEESPAAQQSRRGEVNLPVVNKDKPEDTVSVGSDEAAQSTVSGEEAVEEASEEATQPVERSGSDNTTDTKTTTEVSNHRSAHTVSTDDHAKPFDEPETVSEAMTFDSILSRRIEKRRATKLKMGTRSDLASLDHDHHSMESSGWDRDDTENHLPSHGHHDSSKPRKQERRKNPFEDDDFLCSDDGEDEDEDEDEDYHPLLTKSSSDDDGIDIPSPRHYSKPSRPMPLPRAHQGSSPRYTKTTVASPQRAVLSPRSNGGNRSGGGFSPSSPRSSYHQKSSPRVSGRVAAAIQKFEKKTPTAKHQPQGYQPPQKQRSVRANEWHGSIENVSEKMASASIGGKVPQYSPDPVGYYGIDEVCSYDTPFDES
ncbi:unnamed protein product [Pseudo-nitzschia multistriata]|uniref:Uncharacterized protein n=1 Tax=Pseudo-nitzschia multistriata TaxID=183589 RepID=A0A448Z1C7_9STRA|nr:unnamed protein product [Pseudo-nitzschia multistriata]